jgi:predicted Zn-dependent peptidase
VNHLHVRAAALAALTFTACKTVPPPDDTINPRPQPATRTATAAAADEAWRATQPGAGPAITAAPPVLREAKLANGLTLLVYESAALPIVTLQLVARGGSGEDPAKKPGVAQLAAQMLAEGAGGRDGFAFADAVADLGAFWGSRVDQDKATIGLSGAARHADAMFGLLADVALRPRFDAKDFAKVQRIQRANLERAKGSPEGLAFERIPGIVYGAAHPYGHPVSGTIEAVERVTLADVRAHHTRVFVPAGAALVVVGDVKFDAVRALAEKHLGAWKGTSKVPASYAAVAARPRKELLFVDMPGAPQTFIVAARPMFGRGHPDASAFDVTTEVFGGGGLGTRLNDNLREAKGYTYGAGASVSARRGVGALVVSTKVRADVTAESVREIFLELERMAIQPPSEEEVSRAKAGLILGLPGEFERIGSIAEVGATIFTYGLPLDHLARELAGLGAVTEDTAAAAAKQYLDPSVMQIVLIGDASAHAKAVEALGLGPVRVVKP